jgi:cytochrome c5
MTTTTAFDNSNRPAGMRRPLLLLLAAAPLALATSLAPAAERSGEQIVKTKCFECHESGTNGAPKIGDREAWVQRVSRGLDAVVATAIHGHGNMPARGGMADLTDPELRSAVVYMFQKSAANKAAK